MRRRRMKKQKKIIIISSLCLFMCLCVGYAAFYTHLSLKAKGNIRIKPHCDFAGIKVNTVTEGDGLYEDIYEEGKCTYKGTDPNNYITFNGETWRIISIDTDKTIKIMRNEDIGNKAWDATGGTYGSNDWNRPADLNTYLNETYLFTIADVDKIVSHDWPIGSVVNNNNDLSVQIMNENSKMWSGNVGLITVSEYLRANKNMQQCGTLSLNNTNKSTCLTTNWMYSIVPSAGFLWTVSAVSDSSNFVHYVYSYGNVASRYVNSGYYVAPVVYLKSIITLSGSGTQTDPYVINE